MIIGEHDQTFGDSLAYSRRSGLSSLGRFGDYKPLNYAEGAPIRIVKVVDSKNGSPVAGVQLNIFDEDRTTVLSGGVTDKNGVAVLRVGFNYPTVSENNRRNYIRTMLLPVGYDKPSPRTVTTDVSFYETKYGGLAYDSDENKRLRELLLDTSKAKPDVTIKVDQVGKPLTRVIVPASDVDSLLPDYVTSDEAGNKTPRGLITFRLILPDGKLAKYDVNTPFLFNNGSLEKEVDIDQNGEVTVTNHYPGVTSQFTVTPYFGGRTGRLREGKPKPEWAFTRVLTTFEPYPFVYDIKYAKEGGLMPGGRIPDEELGLAPVIKPKLDVPKETESPSGRTLRQEEKKTNPLLYILIGALIVGAVAFYVRSKKGPDA